MIKYMLQCQALHQFEAWFGRGSDFDLQAKEGLLLCPECLSDKICKAPMAPAIRPSKSSPPPAVTEAQRTLDPSFLW